MVPSTTPMTDLLLSQDQELHMCVGASVGSFSRYRHHGIYETLHQCHEYPGRWSITVTAPSVSFRRRVDWNNQWKQIDDESSEVNRDNTLRLVRSEERFFHLRLVVFHRYLFYPSSWRPLYPGQRIKSFRRSEQVSFNTFLFRPR